MTSWSAHTVITNDQRSKAFAREYLAPTKLPGTNDFVIFESRVSRESRVRVAIDIYMGRSTKECRKNQQANRTASSNPVSTRSLLPHNQ